MDESNHLIKYLCVSFCIWSVHILFGIIFFTDIFLVVTTFIFIRILFVLTILAYFFFLNIFSTRIIFSINCDIIIFLKIFLIIIIYLIFFTNVLLIWIILICVISVIIFYFCSIRWYQGNIYWLKSLFSWFPNCLTYDRWIWNFYSEVSFCIWIVLSFPPFPV